MAGGRKRQKVKRLSPESYGKIFAAVNAILQEINDLAEKTAGVEFDIRDDERHQKFRERLTNILIEKGLS